MRARPIPRLYAPVSAAGASEADARSLVPAPGTPNHDCFFSGAAAPSSAFLGLDLRIDSSR